MFKSWIVRMHILVWQRDGYTHDEFHRRYIRLPFWKQPNAEHALQLLNAIPRAEGVKRVGLVSYVASDETEEGIPARELGQRFDRCGDPIAKMVNWPPTPDDLLTIN